jgi:hypothetical protein
VRRNLSLYFTNVLQPVLSANVLISGHNLNIYVTDASLAFFPAIALISRQVLFFISSLFCENVLMIEEKSSFRVRSQLILSLAKPFNNLVPYLNGNTS